MAGDDSQDDATKVRGRPFEKGNPGRPKGARNKTTILLQTILDGDAEAIVRKAIDLGKQGDRKIVQFLARRLLGPAPGRVINADINEVTDARTAREALGKVFDLTASGELTLEEGEALARQIGRFVKVVEVAELEGRVEALDDFSDSLP